jgi:hypothetical protein
MSEADVPPSPEEVHLALAVMEIEAHVADAGWDQPGRLYALVETQNLLEHEPELAEALGLGEEVAAGALTPIEQDHLQPDLPMEQVLETIAWPESVAGCAAVVERLVLPPGVDDDLPEDAEAATDFAREHPLRQEVRIVAAVTRAGATYCALRLRAHDDDQSVVGGVDLVPGLLDLLGGTLAEHDGRSGETT